MISYLCMASQNEVTRALARVARCWVPPASGRLATSVRQLRTVDNRAAHDHLRDLAPLLRAALQQVRELL
jgi:hypothetical protein